jgi:hypothetical protein
MLIYTGLGPAVNTRNQMTVKGEGPIDDRTSEHLGRTDNEMLAYCCPLLRAIDMAERGKRPLFTFYRQSRTAKYSTLCEVRTARERMEGR